MADMALTTFTPEQEQLLASVRERGSASPELVQDLLEEIAGLRATEQNMLAALQEVAHHADDEWGFMVLVRAAIAKATGAT